MYNEGMYTQTQPYFYSFSLYCKTQPSCSFNETELALFSAFTRQPARRPKPPGRESNFQHEFSVDIKSKVASLHGQTIEITSHLYPIFTNVKMFKFTITIGALITPNASKLVFNQPPAQEGFKETRQSEVSKIRVVRLCQN